MTAILKTLLFTVLMLNISCVSFGQSEATDPKLLKLSLNEALNLAQTQQIDILVSKERVQQAIARLGQARSVLWPQISLDGQQARETTNLKAIGITLPASKPVIGPFNSFDARFNLTQTLFDMSVIGRLRAAKAAKDLSRAEEVKTKQDVLALVANLFLEASRAQDAIGLARAYVERSQKNFEITELMFQNGTGSELELKQAKADLHEAKQLFNETESTAVERQLDLTAALGIPNDSRIEYIETDLFSNVQIPQLSEVGDVKEKHPDVLVARQQFYQRKAERWTELVEFLPKVSGFGNYGESGTTPTSWDATYAFGAKVTWPLFEGGNRWFKYREAQSQARESQKHIENIERNAEATALSSIQKLKHALIDVDAKEEAWLVAQKQLAITRGRTKTGIGSDYDVIKALADESLAHDQRNEAVSVYQLSQVNLLHSMGKLDAFLKSKKENP